MSSKYIIEGSQIIPAGTSAAISQTSHLLVVDQLDKLYFHIAFTSPASGSFTLLVQNGKQDTPYALSISGGLNISNETDVEIRLDEVPFTQCTLVWNPTAGTGTMTATATGKALGS